MTDEPDDKTRIERDRAWRAAVMGGWTAEDELWEDCRPRLTAALLAKFRGSAAMTRMVPDAVVVTLAKALSRDKGAKITAWNGDKPLLAYLTAVASKQVLEWCKKKRADPWSDLCAEDERLTEPSTDPEPLLGDAVSATAQEILCRFADAVHMLGESQPRQLIILALKALGAQQGDAAALWGVDKGQASHEQKKVTEQLMKQFGGEVGFMALCELAERRPEVWCGRHPGQPGNAAALSDADKDSLLALCGAPANKTLMKQWEPRLWQDEAALIWLRECLNAVRRKEPPLEESPLFKGQGKD